MIHFMVGNANFVVFEDAKNRFFSCVLVFIANREFVMRLTITIGSNGYTTMLRCQDVAWPKVESG